MAHNPRSTIKTILDTYIAANPITKDDGVTNASVGSIYERGPELFKYLFFSVGFDVIITYGEPRTRSIRPIQDVPVHFQMGYPVTVTTVDKYSAGVLVCTASRMQNTARNIIRAAIAASAQSAPAATPAYTLRITPGETGKNYRQGGVDIWEDEYVITYETGGP